MSHEIPFKDFSQHEHDTWGMLFKRQAEKRSKQIYSTFDRGIALLNFNASHIPDLNETNKRLAKLTGFRAVPVAGLEKDRSFFEMMARREFPIGNFIREREDLSYTPAPDVFHDLYGHIPFLTDKAYADFSAKLGQSACKFSEQEEGVKQFSRLYWFGVEFPLIKTPEGKRIFGAGIASSHGECAFALSDDPEVRPFDPERIRNHDFRIDEFQRILYLIENVEQLYSCLPEYEKKVERSLKH